jgi:hypothetical protein
MTRWKKRAEEEWAENERRAAKEGKGTQREETDLKRLRQLLRLIPQRR